VSREVVRPVTNESVTITIPIRWSDLDGLAALCSWIDGFKAGGHGEIPGDFDLVMHVRSLRSAVWEASKRGDSLGGD